MKNKNVIVTSAILLSLTGCEGSGDSATGSTIEYETAIAIENTTGQELTYKVVDGQAILGGDIVIGTHDDVQANGISLVSGSYQSYAIINTERTWDDGIVPFIFSDATSFDGQVTARLAMAAWESMTNIRFVERTTQNDYVVLNQAGPCNSSVGRVGGSQALNFNYGEGISNCVDHEIGHALGLHHEMSRSDRDEHIDIHWDNMQDSTQNQYYMVTDMSINSFVGDYNLKSLMHYSANVGAIDASQPVFTPYDGSIDIDTIGIESTPISEGDAEAVIYSHGDVEPAKYVHITKSNSTGYALDGGWGGENDQNVYLWTANNTNVNQMWEQIDQGDGYYSYRKRFTSFCMDGGSEGESGQTVKLWACDDTDENQHWKRTWKSGGMYQLVKRNATGFAINGKSNGANGQDVNLYNSNNKSGNLKWVITPVTDNVTSF